MPASYIYSRRRPTNQGARKKGSGRDVIRQRRLLPWQPAITLVARALGFPVLLFGLVLLDLARFVFRFYSRRAAKEWPGAKVIIIGKKYKQKIQVLYVICMNRRRRVERAPREARNRGNCL